MRHFMVNSLGWSRRRAHFVRADVIMVSPAVARRPWRALIAHAGPDAPAFPTFSLDKITCENSGLPPSIAKGSRGKNRILQCGGAARKAVPWPSWPCRSTGKMPVALGLCHGHPDQNHRDRSWPCRSTGKMPVARREVAPLAVDLSPVCDFNHQDGFLRLGNRANHAAGSLTDPVLFLRGEFSRAGGAGVAAESGDPGGDAGAIFPGNRLQLPRRRGLDQDPIAFHAAS
jgi:hypothetical protein